MKKVDLRKICIVVMLFAVCLSACSNGSAKKEEKQVVKYMEWEYPNQGTKGETEYNELGDVVLTTSIANGKTTTSNYRWEYIGDSRKAYSEDGTFVQEIQLDENGNKISSKSYDKDNRVTSEYTYQYDNSGNLQTSSLHTYGYEHYKSDGLIIRREFYYEYGENENIVKEHSVGYSYGREDAGYPWVETKSDTYIEYNEYGEIISEKYVSEGVEKENTIYEYQRSKDGKNSVGRAYVYDGESQELIEEYDEYEYEYDENKNMISKCRYTSEGNIVERTYQEYNEKGSLLASYLYMGENLYYVRNYTYYE